MQKDNPKRILFIFSASLILMACVTFAGPTTNNAKQQIKGSQDTIPAMEGQSDELPEDSQPDPVPEDAQPEIEAGSVSTNPIDELDVIYIPQGTFTMGSDEDFNLRRGFCVKPQHKVTLNEYWIDKTEVTVAAFRRFVDDTGYVTEGEKLGNAGWIWSYKINGWEKIESPDKGPTWRKPLGGKKEAVGIEEHPVTQVSWNDAVAYCEWVGGRLPTEAE